MKKLKGVGATLAEVEESFREEGSKIQERRNRVEILENDRDEMQLSLDDFQLSIETQIKSIDARYQLKMSEASQLADLTKGIE